MTNPSSLTSEEHQENYLFILRSLKNAVNNAQLPKSMKNELLKEIVKFLADGVVHPEKTGVMHG